MSIGETLAEARRGAGLNVTEVSQRTRIRETLVKDIERDDYSGCGGDFYTRGHIRAIARVVGTDPEPLIEEYDAARWQAAEAAGAEEPPQFTSIRMRGWPQRRDPSGEPATGPIPRASETGTRGTRQRQELPGESPSEAGTRDSRQRREPPGDPAADVSLLVWPAGTSISQQRLEPPDAPTAGVSPLVIPARAPGQEPPAGVSPPVTPARAPGQEPPAGVSQPVAPAAAPGQEPPAEQAAAVPPRVPVGRWLPGHEPPETDAPPWLTPIRIGPRWPNWTVLAGIVLVAVIGLLGYFFVAGSGQSHAGTPAARGLTTPRQNGASHSPATRATPRSTPPPAASPDVPLTPVSAAAFGVGGLGQGDNPQRARLAIDHSRATAWSTDWYTTARFANLYSGTGLLLDMGRPVTITSAQITLGNAPGAAFQLRVGSAPSLADLRPVAQATGVSGTVRLRLGTPAQGRYVLIWFTRLPPDPAGTFRASVHNVSLEGRA